MDSLDTIELIMMLEEEFGIEIRDGDEEGINIISDVVDYIEAKLFSLTNKCITDCYLKK
jgi:acyl carrier protein